METKRLQRDRPGGMQVFVAVTAVLCCSLAGRAEDTYVAARTEMVRQHITRLGVADQRVIAALRATPRHEFVPLAVRDRAYQDRALPIGFGQTISSPYIVARMTEQLDPQPQDRVLEVGTGSGYQAAVLSPLVKEVYSIEIVPELGERARETLNRLQYRNVRVRIGDGYQGWKQQAPFDKIIVTCSPESIPQPLVTQLAEGGRLVIPVGERFQQTLYRFTKTGDQLRRERVEATFFVPMTGRAEQQRRQQATQAQILNGGFEERAKDGQPLSWYYLRGGQVKRDESSPQATHCIQFTRRDSSPAHALQPLGVDGRTTTTLSVRFWSKGQGLRTGLLAVQTSQLLVEFYDEQRNRCGEADVPLRRGSFPWTQHAATIEVPPTARHAVVEVGLFGAVTGTIAFDDIRVAAVE